MGELSPIGSWLKLDASLQFIYDGPVQPAFLRLHQQLTHQSAILIREGHAQISTKKNVTNATAGQWLLPQTGDVFKVLSPESKVFSIHFHLKWPWRQPVYDLKISSVIDAQEFPELEKTGIRLHQSVKRHIPRGGPYYRATLANIHTHLDIHCHFLKWVDAYASALEASVGPSQTTSPLDQRITQVIRCLEDTTMPERFKINHLASKVGLSENQLSRLFVKHFNMPMNQYLARWRLEDALTRVQHSKSSFKEIAFELGFNSPSHFSSWFFRMAHKSPRELREESYGQDSK